MDIEFLLFLCFLASLFIVPAFLRERTKRAGFELIARALERGQTLDPETITKLTSEQQRNDRGRNNLGIGIVLSALAGGCMIAAFILTQTSTDAQLQDFLVPAALLGVLGLAFLLLAALDGFGRKS